MKLPLGEMLLGLGWAPSVGLTPCDQKLMPALVHALKDHRLREMTDLLKVKLP